MKSWFYHFVLPKSPCFLLLVFLPTLVSSQGKPDPGKEIWIQEAKAFHSLSGTEKIWYTDYDVIFCHLDLHLERNTVFVEGSVTTQARSKVEGLQNYLCELVKELTVDSVEYNGSSAVFYHRGDSLEIILASPPFSGNVFTVKVYYHGTPPTGGFYTGISTGKSVKWGNDVTWTLSEPFNAYQWWPCKQDLKDKYDSAWIYITTDSSSKAGSNGLLTNIATMPGGKLRYEWKTRYPIDYYLISAAVSDYQEYNLYAHPAGTLDSVLIQNYIYDAQGCLDYYKNELDNTRYHLELYSRLFGPYPFMHEKYGHCLVNLGGGMEHQTMGSLGDFNFHLTCHELSHQWFGDYVTCASWSDIWLNEGFATYAQYLSLQYLTAQAYADSFMMGVHNYVMSQAGGSVYIPPAMAVSTQRIFDGRLSYNKGAAIIHALRAEINDDSLFFKVLKNYLNTFGHGVASGEDFKQITEMATGKDFSYFFDQWYYGEGFPVYDILYFQSADSLNIWIKQSASTQITPFFKMKLEIKVFTGSGDTLIKLLIDKAEMLVKIPVRDSVENLVVDPFYQHLLWVNSLTHSGKNDKNPVLHVFPNPGNQVMNFYLTGQDTGPYKVKIVDVQGRLMKSFKQEAQTGALPLDEFSCGVYFLEVQGKYGSATKRFIKR